MHKLWSYNAAGECSTADTRKLPQPLVHMLANGPQYFAISDNWLRGYSGFDYTRMFGEFDGPNFPKGNGRFLWLREKGKAWLVNDPDPRAGEEASSFFMGMGYVRYEKRSKKTGLDVSATLFVPLGEMCEVMTVEITNTSRRARSLDFIPTVPIFGGSRAYTEYHRDVVRLYNKSRVTDHIEIHPGLEWVEGSTDASDICYYMGAETEKGKKGSRFYSDRESFLGAAYSFACPDAILNDRPPAFQCLGKEAVGAIEFRKLAFKPGETKRFVIVCGIAHGSAKTEDTLKSYDWKGAATAFDKLSAFWKERTSRIEISTGDKQFNLLWNTWWCYQLSMRYWFGNTGHPQFDYGSDFAGWRDFWQDMMAATVIDPSGLEKRTLHTLEGIRADGTNATRFFARTKEFGSDELNGLWCDHPYWTTQTVLLLANFLGDKGFLLRDGISYFRDSYRDRGDTKDIEFGAGRIERQKDTAGKVYTGTVAEHLLTQLLTMYYDVGNGDLLKQKRADWNDAVDQVKGENVTFSMGLAQDCRELAAALEETGKRCGVSEIQLFEELAGLVETWPCAGIESDPVPYKQKKLASFLAKANTVLSGRKVNVNITQIADDLRNKADTIIKVVNKRAWNGHYYIGYFHADGTPVDSIFTSGALGRKNPTTNDFVMMLMPQTWSLLSGAADTAGVSETVVQSTRRHLYDPVVGAMKLNYPAYWKFNKKVGRITGFAAGTKENNAVFCHANLFLSWALLKRRRADEAYAIFRGVNPLNHPQDVIKTGPWIPEYYISSDNPNWPSRGEYPMLTASGGWTRHLFQNFFFGLRGELDGLRIDPCLPASPEFKDCSVSMSFRGARYKIHFRNPRLRKGASVKSVSVDGKLIEGTLVKPFASGEHEVEVALG